MYLAGDVRLLCVTDHTRPFGLIKDALQQEDVVYGNLEGALYDEIDPYEFFSKVTWRHAGTSGAQALREGNFAAVGLANNVIVGDEAIESTLGILDKLGIAHTGAGMNLAAARAPAIVERNGVRYGFLQRTSIFWPYRHKAVPEGPHTMPGRKYGHGHYTAGETLSFFGAPGVATIRPHTAYEPSFASTYEAGGAAIIHTWPDADDMDEFLADIKALRPLVDVLVTSNHWRVTTGADHGPENGELARDFRVEVAHAAIDAGADIVASHGTHRIEEIEVYKGRAIFYGLGELFFGTHPEESKPPPRPRYTKVKLLARAELEGKSIRRVSCRFVISGGRSEAEYQSVFRRPGEEPEALEHLIERSRYKFGTELRPNEEDITVI